MTHRTTFSLLLFLAVFSAAANAGSLVVLNYHNVVADTAGDRYAVSRSQFVAQMDYLQQNGYQPISLSYVEQVISNEAPLPDKAILLTFDDGLKSFHDFVAPVLAIYQFPSVISLVSSWMDGVNVPPEYQGKLMSWNDARNLTRDRGVTIASHTHNLHRGILSNPQNNVRGAATTRQYFPQANGYEDENSFRERVRNDIKVSMARMKDELGIEPRSIAWPYGEYDQTVYEEARGLNLRVQFALADGNLANMEGGVLGRVLLVDQPSLVEFAKLLEPRAQAPRRFVDLRLDHFVGKSAEEQERLLSELLDSLEPRKLTAIIISPVTQDGKKTFFETASAEVATNILDRVIHQIRTRLNIRFVVLRMPARVVVRNRGEFFTDLARLNRFEGVAFESGVPRELQADARSIVPRYRINVKFGLFDDIRPGAEYDFHILSESAWQRSSGVDPVRDWVMVDGPGVEPELIRAAGASVTREYLNYGFPFDSISKSSDARRRSDGVKRKGG